MRSAATLSALTTATLLVSACAPGPGTGAQAESGAGPASGTGNGASAAGEPAGPVNAAQRDSRTEVASLSPRVVISHDGGLVTLDAETGETIHEEPLEGFLRLNNAGDGQHVMVTNGDEFQVYNSGIDAQGHGDHFHYYESTSGLTGITFEAPHAGHVVTHHGLTTLFADGER